MFIVAITGGIATGKSTVTKVFKEEGVPIVDADLIAREGMVEADFVISSVSINNLFCGKQKTCYLLINC